MNIKNTGSGMLQCVKKSGTFLWSIHFILMMTIIIGFCSHRLAGDVLAAGIPALISPSDGAVLNDSTPDLAWYPCDANYYQVEIATDSNFSNKTVIDHWDSANYTPDPPLQSGTYWWHVRAYYLSSSLWSGWSSAFHFTISTGTVNPRVSSTSGRIGDPLSQPGTGFTPNGVAELHFRRPDGSLSPLTTENVRSDGGYDHSWPIPSDAQLGTYQYWAVDLSSGQSSPEVSYYISSGIVNPRVSSTSGCIGEPLSQPGTGFTPNGVAQLHFRRPDGSLSPVTTENVRSDGGYDHSWPIPSDAQLGTYQYWAVDLTSGQFSPEVSYSIIGRATATLQYPWQNGTVFDHRIVFEWSDVPSFANYELLVDNASGFGSPEIHTSLQESRYEAENWLPQNVYYWKVITHFTDGSTTESPVWSFTYLPQDEPKAVLVPLYRYYKGGDKKDHFFTTSPTQGAAAVGDGYSYERIECYVSDRKFSGSAPLMRLYNPAINSHYYTTDESKRDQMVTQEGYQYEGIQAFVFESNSQGAVPLYRMKQPKLTDYHYHMCTRQNEHEKVLANSVWQFEDDEIAGYVYITGTREPAAITKPQGNYGGVDMATHAFRYTPPHYDIALHGVGPAMVFRHYYNSFKYMTAPMGQGWTHSFYSYIVEDHPTPDDPGHNYVDVKWGDGSEMFFIYDGINDKYISEPGNYSTLTRVSDSNSNNEGYDLKTKDQTVYKFRKLTPNTLGSPIPEIYLKFVQDRNGNTLTLDWTASQGLLSNVTDASGRQFLFKYEDSRFPYFLTSVEETALNRSVAFSYDEGGRLVFFTDARKQKTEYRYNEKDLLQNIIMPEKNAYNVWYNQDGTVTYLQEGSAHSAQINPISTNGDVRTTQVTTPTGVHLNFECTNYSLTNLMVGSLPPIHFSYTDSHNPTLPTEVVDRHGHTTRYTYNVMGNVTSITNPIIETTAELVYDSSCLYLKSQEDFHLIGFGSDKTLFEYYDNGNVKDIYNQSNENIHFVYNTRGLIEQSRDGRLQTTSYQYNTEGNLTKITDPEGNATEFYYDKAGRMLWQKDATGKYAYHDYDPNDNPASFKDHDQFTVFTNFDFNNNMKLIRWLKNGVTSDTKYEYDAQDRLHYVENPIGKFTYYNYYANGALQSKTSQSGDTVNYAYDGNGLLQAVSYPDHVRRIVRDLAGLIEKISSPNGDTSFSYDDLDRVKTTMDPYGNIVKYTYNPKGLLDKVIYPDEKEVTYEYYPTKRLKTVKWINDVIATYYYDASGNIEHIVRPNNTEAIYSYDKASRLTGVTERKTDGTLICAYTYYLNPVGDHDHTEIAKEPLAPPVPESTDMQYTHDKANRLMSAGPISFTYDDKGNRKTRTNGPETTTYEWDQENMLTKVIGPTPGRTVQYYYDGMNNRIARVEDGNWKRYVLDRRGGMTQVLAETDANGNITAYYVYGLGLVSRITGGSNQSKVFYHFNNRGDVIALTNDQGINTDAYAYNEYGNLVASQGVTPNPFKFIGRYGVMDEGDKLTFMRARFYDAGVGKFVNEDPIGFSGRSWNLYGYGGNNPLISIDPLGLVEDYAQDLLELSSKGWEKFTVDKITDLGNEAFCRGFANWLDSKGYSEESEAIRAYFDMKRISISSNKLIQDQAAIEKVSSKYSNKAIHLIQSSDYYNTHILNPNNRKPDMIEMMNDWLLNKIHNFFFGKDEGKN